MEGASDWRGFESKATGRGDPQAGRSEGMGRMRRRRADSFRELLRALGRAETSDPKPGPLPVSRDECVDAAL